MAKQQANGGQIKNLSATRHNSTTKVKQADVRIEFGWGAFTIAGAAASSGQEVVAFDTAFTDIPIVTITFGGDQTSGAEALGSGANVIHGSATAKVTSVSVNGFSAYVWTSGGTWPVGSVVYYHWVAIGR